MTTLTTIVTPAETALTLAEFLSKELPIPQTIIALYPTEPRSDNWLIDIFH